MVKDKKQYLISLDLAERLQSLVEDQEGTFKALCEYLVEVRLAQHAAMQQVDFTKGADYVAMQAAKQVGLNLAVDMVFNMPKTVHETIEYCAKVAAAEAKAETT